MNSYRLVYQYDDFDEYMCLKCKNRFISDDEYKYCPICGTKWDGIFRQHKKYRLTTPNINAYPLLKVEVAHFTGWNMYIRYPLCPRYWNGEKCISHTVIRFYHQACKSYNKVRLLYMTSPTRSFIVKQKI